MMMVVMMIMMMMMVMMMIMVVMMMMMSLCDLRPLFWFARRKQPRWYSAGFLGGGFDVQFHSVFWVSLTTWKTWVDPAWEKRDALKPWGIMQTVQFEVFWDIWRVWSILKHTSCPGGFFGCGNNVLSVCAVLAGAEVWPGLCGLGHQKWVLSLPFCLSVYIHVPVAHQLLFARVTPATAVDSVDCRHINLKLVNPMLTQPMMEDSYKKLRGVLSRKFGRSLEVSAHFHVIHIWAWLWLALSLFAVLLVQLPSLPI
jgi:hypothetical protein